jgi:hypothetical protein
MKVYVKIKNVKEEKWNRQQDMLLKPFNWVFKILNPFTL